MWAVFVFKELIFSHKNQRVILSRSNDSLKTFFLPRSPRLVCQRWTRKLKKQYILQSIRVTGLLLLHNGTLLERSQPKFSKAVLNVFGLYWFNTGPYLFMTGLFPLGNPVALGDLTESKPLNSGIHGTMLQKLEGKTDF